MSYNKRAFVTFRIMGDDLDPGEITHLLGVPPSVAYRRGESYFAGERTGKLRGKTGLWMLSTDKGVKGNNLHDHFVALLTILGFDHLQTLPNEKPLSQFPLHGRLLSLHDLLKARKLTASVTCFWHGVAGARPPAISRDMRSLFSLVPIAIETDFAVDEPSDPPVRAFA
jgi:hypothetical protein